MEEKMYIEVTYHGMIYTELSEEDIEGLLYEALQIGDGIDGDLIHMTVQVEE